MPNSKIYEQGTVLPSGGTAQTFLNPTLPRMKGVGDVVSEGLGVQSRPNFWEKPNVSQFATQSQLISPKVEDPSVYRNNGDATESVMNYLLSGNEEKFEKENESKKKLLLLTDALRHLGNLYFTTKGATPQKLTSSVPDQENLYQNEKLKRQRERSLVVQQALDVAKQKADEEYRNGLLGQKQAELERKQALDNLNFTLNLQKQKDLNAYRDKQNALANDKLNETKRHNSSMESLGRQRVAISWANSQNKKDKDSIEIRSYQDGKNMFIGKDKLNDATFKSDTRKTYNELVKKNAIPPVKGKRWDGEGWVEYDKSNPTTNEMIEAMQEGSWSYPYMMWANKYANNPMEITKKPTIKHIKVNKKVNKAYSKGKVEDNNDW